MTVLYVVLALITFVLMAGAWIGCLDALGGYRARRAFCYFGFAMFFGAILVLIMRQL